MYVVVNLSNNICYAMHRSELETLNLRGIEAMDFYDSLEDAVKIANQLNSICNFKK